MPSDPRDLDAQHTERLATVGRLAAGVAHEINNPAAFVVANLRVLRGAAREGQRLIAVLRARLGPNLDGESRQALSAIEELLHDSSNILNECRDGMTRITSLAQNLCSFARNEHPAEPEAVSLEEVARSAITLSRPRLRHRCRVVVDLHPVGPVLGNRSELGQVLVNLLVNAGQAIPEDGGDHEIRIRLRKERERAFLSVSDTGCGMSEEVRRRIFDPFFTTKAAGHGTGLGLALARDILEEHGGRLHVESVLGKGSRFTLELPLARENVRVSEPARAPSTPPPASSLRMLIVDDEPLLLRAYQRTLGTHHDLTVAATGERAIGLLRAGTEFDVILCDLMMPGVDGRQVYAGALAIDESIAERIVFVSGGAFDESTARFLESIDNTVLAKPVDSAKLNKILQSVRSRRPPRESGVTLRRRALEVRAAFEPKKTRAS